jgi:hypothetical protein
VARRREAAKEEAKKAQASSGESDTTSETSSSAGNMLPQPPGQSARTILEIVDGKLVAFDESDPDKVVWEQEGTTLNDKGKIVVDRVLTLG